MLLNFNQICYIYWKFDTSDFLAYQLLYSYTVDILVLVKTPDLGSLFLTFNNFLCVFICNCYCLRAIRQINIIVKYVPSRNKVYIHYININYHYMVKRKTWHKQLKCCIFHHGEKIFWIHVLLFFCSLFWFV